MSERPDSPFWSRLLSERGLGTMLAVVLVGALLWFGARLLSDLGSFQAQMIAESVRTNEQLSTIQLNQLEMKIQMDRIERLMIAEQGGRP